MYAIIDASSNTIPTTYGTGAGSKILSSSPCSGHITVINTTSEVIAFTITSHPNTLPADSTTTNTNQYLVPAAPSGGGSATTMDQLPIKAGDIVYIKSTGSAASSGKVMVVVW